MCGGPRHLDRPARGRERSHQHRRGQQDFSVRLDSEAPQDKKYADEPTRLEIGDRNVIREYCTISRGTTHDRGVTQIGNDNLLMAYTHVAHDCVLGDNVIMVNLAMIAGHVTIGDWAILSGYVAVHQHCKIGAHAFIANNTGVTRDVPPFVMAIGNPAVRTRSIARDSSAAVSRPSRSAISATPIGFSIAAICRWRARSSSSRSSWTLSPSSSRSSNSSRWAKAAA